MEIIDPNGNSTTFDYDSYGRLAGIKDAEGGYSTKTYDLMSNVITKTDPAGRTTDFSYNDMNLVAKIKHCSRNPETGEIVYNPFVD